MLGKGLFEDAVGCEADGLGAFGDSELGDYVGVALDGD